MSTTNTDVVISIASVVFISPAGEISQKYLPMDIRDDICVAREIVMEHAEDLCDSDDYTIKQFGQDSRTIKTNGVGGGYVSLGSKLLFSYHFDFWIED